MKKIVLLTLTFLIILSGFTFSYFEEDIVEEVIVNLPTFDVQINDQIIDSTKEEYPLIVYKNITYIPMTWNISHALGIKFNWNAQTGIKITKAKEADILKLNSNNLNLDSSYKASLCKEVVEVNGRIIDNSSEMYPLLTFRNITYFPMTYQFMVKDFATEYTFKTDTGLSISASSELAINYPESKIIKKDIMIDELFENDGYIDNDIEIIPNDSQAMNLCISYENEEMRDKIINVKINYYDNNEQYVMTKDFLVGGIFRKNQSRMYGFGRSLVLENQAKYYKKVEIVIEFIEPEVAYIHSKKYKETNKINVEFLTSDEITKDKFVSDGGYFLSSVRDRCSNYNDHPDERLLQYAGCFNEDTYYIEDYRNRISFITEALKTYEDASEYYWEINKYSSFQFEDTVFKFNQFKGYYNEFEKSEAHGQFIRLYDEEKKLIKVYIITDKLGDNG